MLRLSTPLVVTVFHDYVVKLLVDVFCKFHILTRSSLPQCLDSQITVTTRNNPQHNLEEKTPSLCAVGGWCGQ